MRVRKDIIQRVTITGKREEFAYASDWCYNRSYDMVVSGPMPIAKMRYDTTRFRIVAERVVRW